MYGCIKILPYITDTAAAKNQGLCRHVFFQQLSVYIFLFYHKDIIRDHRLVVHRLPLEGKLAAVPCLRKRPAATTDEVDRRASPYGKA